MEFCTLLLHVYSYVINRVECQTRVRISRRPLSVTISRNLANSSATCLPWVETRKPEEGYNRASDSMMARPKVIHFSWLGPKLFRLLLDPTGLDPPDPPDDLICFSFPVVLFV